MGLGIYDTNYVHRPGRKFSWTLFVGLICTGQDGLPNGQSRASWVVETKPEAKSLKTRRCGLLVADAAMSHRFRLVTTGWLVGSLPTRRSDRAHAPVFFPGGPRRGGLAHQRRTALVDRRNRVGEIRRNAIDRICLRARAPQVLEPAGATAPPSRGTGAVAGRRNARRDRLVGTWVVFLPWREAVQTAKRCVLKAKLAVAEGESDACLV